MNVRGPQAFGPRREKRSLIREDTSPEGLFPKGAADLKILCPLPLELSVEKPGPDVTIDGRQRLEGPDFL